jgi:hypothetical protein
LWLFLSKSKLKFVERDCKQYMVILLSMVNQDDTDELSTSRLEPFQLKAVCKNAVIGIQGLFHILFHNRKSMPNNVD